MVDTDGQQILATLGRLDLDADLLAALLRRMDLEQQDRGAAEVEPAPAGRR